MGNLKFVITTLNAKYIHTNLAIRILYQLNKTRVSNLHWKEFTIKQSINEIVEDLLHYDRIAFSCYIWNITPILQCVHQLKTRNPQVKILLGGPEVSYDAEHLLNTYPIDAICYDEGERPFSDWLQQSNHPDTIAGIFWKNNDTVIRNPPALKTPVECLAAIQPYADDITSEMANKVLYIETSRGCPYKCHFCLASLDNKVRYLPESYIFDTLKYLILHGKTIKFLDRTFNLKKEFTLKIFDFIVKHHKPNQTFQFEITSDILHPDIISYIRTKIPPRILRFEIGIQSINASTNKAVARIQNFEKTKSVIAQIQGFVTLHLDLIAGLPYEQFQDITKGIDEVMALFPDELQLGILKFLKGTPLRDYKNFNYKFSVHPPYTLISSDFLSPTDVTNIMQIEWALDTLWNGGKMKNWVRYMSSKYSISQVFLQFTKTVQQYYNTLKYALSDLYQAARHVIETFYAQDNYALQVLALDYYAHFKIKPAALVLQPLQGLEKKQACKAVGITAHLGSCMVIPFNFDVQHWLVSHQIQPQYHLQVFQYTGIAKPQLLRYVHDVQAV
jgi:anaerobic magnesium-protoporphyrin IX monomethyl ester cyclase